MVGKNPDDLPSLSDGECIDAEWPRRLPFSPHALSCDPTGQHLVVVDDFGVYTGRLHAVVPTLEHEHRESAAKPPTLATRFGRAPPCAAFEGQALKDISVICSEGSAVLGTDSACRILALHATGDIAECTFAPAVTAPLASGSGLSFESSVAGSIQPQAPLSAERATVLWKISQDWLDAKSENVQSIAVDNECLGDGKLEPEEAGCVLVGTASGRIVQLRRHMSGRNELVPVWTIHRRIHSVNPGSLFLLPGGLVLALRPALGVVQAFDAQGGNHVGAWRLPPDAAWSALCVGGGNVFILGRAGPLQAATLWRFPVPPELKAWQRPQQPSSVSEDVGYQEI